MRIKNILTLLFVSLLLPFSAFAKAPAVKKPTVLKIERLECQVANLYGFANLNYDKDTNGVGFQIFMGFWPVGQEKMEKVWLTRGTDLETDKVRSSVYGSIRGAGIALNFDRVLDQPGTYNNVGVQYYYINGNLPGFLNSDAWGTCSTVELVQK
jgi:hypothetical protein